MRKIYYTLAITTLAFTSCNDLLDRMPDNKLVIDSPKKIRAEIGRASCRERV